MPKVKAAELPMLFSGPLVRAIQAGTKTQTRRIIKPQPPHWANDLQPPIGQRWTFNGCHPVGPCESEACAHIQSVAASFTVTCPYFVGQRLWVRETWRAVEREGGFSDGILFAADDHFQPIADNINARLLWREAYANGKWGEGWRPSIFMPRWASRLTLEVVSVRAERLQNISEADAMAEGIRLDENGHAIRADFPAIYDDINWGGAVPAFAELWNSINGKRADWASNPWCWVVIFKRVENG